MGRPWAADLPLVSVAQGSKPKRITVIVPYYENPLFLCGQLKTWADYQKDISEYVSFIVVDDGSPEHPVWEGLTNADVPERLRIFRIGVDVRWNWLAARNIGFHHAQDGWCFVTDMDHLMPEAIAARLVYGQHDPAVIYGLSRREHTGAPLHAHPNTWFLTREMFWKVGGYDETLSGHYGTDGEWRRRCAATAPMAILSDELVRYEHMGDSSTTRYLRKQPQDAKVKRLVMARKKGWAPKTLSFPYREVSLRGAPA